MKVNMTPNPLDVVTIHASQGDTEARQWEFELHNNGELIDTSEITEQLFFKAYKGGTEQILPENTSTPTTSPFKGDIKYPQGLLSDQEFTYRQSPTEEDGLAKITDIKGNTLVWNQLIQNGNFESTSGWSSGGNRGTLSASNNELSYTITEIGTSTELNRIQRSASFTQNHIYLLMFDFYALRNGTMRGILGGSQNVRGRQISCVSGWNKYADILAANSTNTTVQGCFSAQTDYSVGEVVKWRKFMLIDLTMLNDSHITDYDSFRSYYPLDYYSYNQGSLLSFNGNGIKTVGFNQWDEQTQKGYWNASNGNYVSNQSQLCSLNYIPVLPNTNYCYRKTSNVGDVIFYDANKVFISASINMRANAVFTTPSNCYYIQINLGSTYGSIYRNDICINISDTSKNGTYEPYTSSTLSLPISTYFSNGMKSAGSVYDELTPSKATTRIGAVTFNGSENWYYDSNNALFQCAVANAVITNVTTQYDVYTKNNRFEDKSWATRTSVDGSLGMYYGASYIYIKSTQFADVNAIKTWLQSNPVTVYYELATPTETSFTTASLVTENAEIPLSNNDGVLIGKCTEQLSAEPGFHDAKIKLADTDGECYSNKIQLHIERSPQ